MFSNNPDRKKGNALKKSLIILLYDSHFNPFVFGINFKCRVFYFILLINQIISK